MWVAFWFSVKTSPTCGFPFGFLGGGGRYLFPVVGLWVCLSVVLSRFSVKISATCGFPFGFLANLFPQRGGFRKGGGQGGSRVGVPLVFLQKTSPYLVAFGFLVNIKEEMGRLEVLLPHS